MKNSLVLIIMWIGGFTACTCSGTKDTVRQVETNLIGPVYIEGDPTWTIEARMAHYGVPGVSIAVIADNKIEWSKSYGVMDKESKKRVTNRTLFQAGSISKPVAAYGALRLVLENKIALDEDINSYLKTWHLPDNEWTARKKVTLRQLLSHTAGTTVHGFLGYSPDLPVPTLSQVLDGLEPANSAAIRVDKLPGESFRYSGGGYCIAQQMMMDIQGKSFPDLMEELILQPLGMENSTYEQPLQDGQLDMAATGYLPDGSMTKGKRHTYPEMAAAGLWTTAEDLAKFAINVQQAYAGKDNRILSQEMAKAMLTSNVSDFIGLGIFLDKRKDDLYFGHGGWDEGFSSQLAAHTEKGYGVVVLTNANQPEFIAELIRSVALTYKWDNFVPVYRSLPDRTALEIDGRYRKGHDELIAVYRKDDALLKKSLSGGNVELVRIADSTFIAREQLQPLRFRMNKQTGKLELMLLNPYTEKAESVYSHMKAEEKLPIERLFEGDFDGALDAYRNLAETDPGDPAIDEDRLNQMGYRLLAAKKPRLAQQLFEINMLLYPNSSNVYDSYAEACMELGEWDMAVANYQKSLAMDPDNHNATKMLARIQQEKDARK
ncbi:serine hydrolase [Negadavirga shengliensis]|uniref:Serine hydrolase n=1 Tax=Negadavirga shengliensis TaxID=1389218 RepID=A0ABV9T6J0_9BACT